MRNNLNPLQHRNILAEAKWKWIQFYWDQIFPQTIPSKIVIGFVKQKAVNWDYTASPFNFQHSSLSVLRFKSLYVNGNSVPWRPLKMEFGDNRNYETAFTRLFDWHSEKCLTMEDFGKEYSLFAFAIDPCDFGEDYIKHQMQINALHFSFQRNGNQQNTTIYCITKCLK